MRVILMLSLSLGCGLLAAGVSVWNSTPVPRVVEGPEIEGFLGAASWTQAIDEARDRNALLLVVTLTTDMVGSTLIRDLQADTEVREALEPFVGVALYLDGPVMDRELASRLGGTAAPLLLVLLPAEPTPVIVDALEPITGSTFERHGLAAELRRASEGRGALDELESRVQASEDDEAAALALALRMEAMGRWAEAAQRRNAARDRSRRAQGALARYGGLSEAMHQGRASRTEAEPRAPADLESPLEARLLREDDKSLLFMGWTRVASDLEHHARAAAEDVSGTYLDVPSKRWERRLRETTRRAWIACPDGYVLPFGALVLERFGRVAGDLDSLDRAFMAAVARTMAQARAEAADPAPK